MIELGLLAIVAGHQVLIAISTLKILGLPVEVDWAKERGPLCRLIPALATSRRRSSDNPDLELHTA